MPGAKAGCGRETLPVLYDVDNNLTRATHNGADSTARCGNVTAAKRVPFLPWAVTAGNVALEDAARREGVAARVCDQERI